MRVRVAEWTKAVVVFLAGDGIPQCEVDVFSINLHLCNEALKDGWDINLVEDEINKPGEQCGTNFREGPSRKDCQQRGLEETR